MNVIEVVDVPHGASEDEARILLNKPCEVNRYMLVQVLPLPSGFRAFYRLVSSVYDKKPGERNTLRIGDGKHEAATAIVRGNAGLSVPKLIELLEQSGITRKKTWVSEARMKQRGKR